MSVTRGPTSYKNSYLTLHITLDGIRPPIWRRVVVPATISLDLLHDMLNLVMGWEDYHLHEFLFGDFRYTEDPEESEHGEDENGVTLGSLIRGEGMKFKYFYDFGDDWQHTVKVERIENIPDDHKVRLTCLGGRRACPPEDVGGIHGYTRYLQALADPKHSEHKNMLRWRGRFDPEAFDMEAINGELAKLTRWSRSRNR
ncbi:MAG: plasmid pRiA4b ORF-3 family protein [Phycisphaerales bacterium]|jgi:hypothetical protein|nr:plasmid pRiA4b ORF-3 family protein [Phycisphaerales bacterium]